MNALEIIKNIQVENSSAGSDKYLVSICSTLSLMSNILTVNSVKYSILVFGSIILGNLPQQKVQ